MELGRESFENFLRVLNTMNRVSKKKPLVYYVYFFVTSHFRENDIFIINPGLGDKLLCKNIDNKIESSISEIQSELVKWSKCSKPDHELGFRLKLEHSKVSENL